MALDRRRFLARLAAGAAGALALGLAAVGLRRARPAPAAPRAAGPLADAIRAQFADLEPDDEVIARFLADRATHAERAQRYDVPDRVDPLGAFLLSTDFFESGAGRGRPLRYVRYYDPYISPCYNPLVRRV